MKNRNKNISKSRLCYFRSVDYIFLASSLAIALGEELSSNDINILATFFAVLSDELALIGAVDVCNSGDSDDVFIAPVPDAAVTYSKSSKKTYPKKVCRKKIIRKKRIKKKKKLTNN